MGTDNFLKSHKKLIFPASFDQILALNVNTIIIKVQDHVQILLIIWAILFSKVNIHAILKSTQS